MFLVWVNNGNKRVWNLREKKVLSKLRKAVRKHVLDDKQALDRVNYAKNIAELNHAIYYKIGTPAFEYFKIVSTLEESV